MYNVIQYDTMKRMRAVEVGDINSVSPAIFCTEMGRGLSVDEKGRAHVGEGEGGRWCEVGTSVLVTRRALAKGAFDVSGSRRRAWWMRVAGVLSGSRFLTRGARWMIGGRPSLKAAAMKRPLFASTRKRGRGGIAASASMAYRRGWAKSSEGNILLACVEACALGGCIAAGLKRDDLQWRAGKFGSGVGITEGRVATPVMIEEPADARGLAMIAEGWPNMRGGEGKEMLLWNARESVGSKEMLGDCAARLRAKAVEVSLKARSAAVPEEMGRI